MTRRNVSRVELLALDAGPRSMARPPGRLMIWNLGDEFPTIDHRGDLEPYDTFEVGNAFVQRVYDNDVRLVARRPDQIAFGWAGTGTINFSALVALITKTGRWWHPDVDVQVKLYEWYVEAGVVFRLGEEGHLQPLTRPEPKLI